MKSPATDPPPLPRRLREQRVPEFVLESGAVLRDVVQAYYLDGDPSAVRDDLVVVFHSLSASPDAMGDWWSDVVGPGKALDTDRYAVLCANLLGSCFGTTGPATSALDPFPPVSLRDMVRLTRLLVDELGARRVRLATGGSLGGMLALEWAAAYPEHTAATVPFAAPAALSAFSLGWNHLQRRAIEVAGTQGMEVARMAGMMVYRTPEEFDERFGRETDAEGKYRMWTYLEHHGARLAARFDPTSYRVMLDAIAGHDVGRGRGGIGPALRAVRGRLIGVGISSDRIYRDAEIREWTREAGCEYRPIDSPHGHDAFLLEPGRVGEILREALGREAEDAPFSGGTR
jgi:homoserine O-acetyltransferase/O-succinyltransferase